MGTPAASRLAIAAELGNPEGFTAASLAADYGLHPKRLQATLGNMKRDRVRLLFAAKTGHRTVRWFGRQEWADAYLAAAPQRTYDPLTRRETTRCGGAMAHTVLSWRRDGPQRLRGSAWWGEDATPVETPATKYTYAAPPPARVLHTNTHQPW